ncbi:hypothetical protein TNCV_4652701 [Trichonephila clavipes]|nr:hypothetical protein TNCV_4652701 [Trichonephila clavipes]
MGKLPDLDIYDRGQIVGAHWLFSFRNRQTARIFKMDSVKSIPRMHGLWKKRTSDRANCKRELARVSPSH